MHHNFFLYLAFKDRFTLEEPTKEEMKLQKRYEFYRILIIPAPRYTQAAQNVLQKKELTANKNGELIEGNMLKNIRWLNLNKRIFIEKFVWIGLMIHFVKFCTGRIRVTKYGPRIFWKKHLLNSMALGYGGCYIPEYIPETNVNSLYHK